MHYKKFKLFLHVVQCLCEKALHCTDNPLGLCLKIATLSQAMVSVAC